jgi:hypothetical protein
VAAILEQRVDALTAWELWLQIHFGLLLPGLCFAFALDLSRSDIDPLDIDATRARYGKNRRLLILRRLIAAIATGLFVNLGTLLWCRQLTVTATMPCFNHDFLICTGVCAIATVTYITFLGAAAKMGLGRNGAFIALLIDLTLGHAEGNWSLITPHRHVAQLIGYSGNLVILPSTSSLILVAIIVASTTWIAARTSP